MLAAVAVLWPSRLAGPVDGAPLDAPADALIIGLALPVLLAINRRCVNGRATRVLIVALLIWKGTLALAAVQDGWCVRFTSPVPLFVNQERIPHAWDVRADWRSDVPACSAIMTRGYASIDRFPVWFYNLPPANWVQPASETDRPPYVSLAIDVTGSLSAGSDGVFAVSTAEDVTMTATIDGAAVAADALANGVALRAGDHRIALNGVMTGERWRLLPQWNGRPVWESASATVTPMGPIDRWLRPWGRWLTVLLVALLVVAASIDLAQRIGNLTAIGGALLLSATAIATGGRNVLMRAMPVVLAAVAALDVPRRLQQTRGAQLMIGVPFLVLMAVRGFADIGKVTWYTSGDDWWLFQRFAYRIYLQGYWLEGGEPSFWFQPFYRWIAGALHMVFGDSSVGELLWDAACAWAGALFAFHVTRVVAGFRWAVASAVLTLVLMTIGPGWYLFGRGLSELTSAGLVYAGALWALRGRHSQKYVLAAGLCAAMAFFTRLNNLPFVIALVAFTLPVRQPAGDWLQWRQWWRRCSKPALAGMLAAIIGAVVLFSLRTYYYTGALNPLSGTQAGARSVWQPSDAGETPAENLLGSVLMVITMSDPPRLEPRALPIAIGIVAAVLGLAGVSRFRELPLNVSVLCLAGLAGAFVARGSAYPGRFSIHLVPVTVALAACSVALWCRRPRARGRIVEGTGL